MENRATSYFKKRGKGRTRWAGGVQVARVLTGNGRYTTHKTKGFKGPDWKNGIQPLEEVSSSLVLKRATSTGEYSKGNQKKGEILLRKKKKRSIEENLLIAIRETIEINERVRSITKVERERKKCLLEFNKKREKDRRRKKGRRHHKNQNKIRKAGGR